MLTIEAGRDAGPWPAEAEARAETVLARAFALSGAEASGPAELSVLLTDDAGQRALNGQWRGKDTSTNVLSFPQVEPFAPLHGLIGDISLAYETLAREAAEMDKDFEDHFAHLLVHGLLHIIGHDHEQEAEAAHMEGLETRILAKLGIADPYEDA